MKEIPLTQGKVTLVDDEDYVWLIKWQWYALWNKRAKSFYAYRGVPRRKIAMHRAILGLKYKDGKQGEHINHNTLDNRRLNLRIATPVQNAMNRGKSTNNTSGFKGVCWNKNRNYWQAHIRVNGILIYLGHYSSRELASAAYCEAVKKYHGAFAYDP